MGGERQNPRPANLARRQDFFRLLAQDAPFFHLELRYDGDRLAGAVLDGCPVALETEVGP